MESMDAAECERGGGCSHIAERDGVPLRAHPAEARLRAPRKKRCIAMRSQLSFSMAGQNLGAVLFCSAWKATMYESKKGSVKPDRAKHRWAPRISAFLVVLFLQPSA